MCFENKIKVFTQTRMSQYQLYNREAPNLLSMPGLVDSQALRSAKVAVEAPKVNPETPSPKMEVSETPKKKLGRPRKVQEPPGDSEVSATSDKPKKKLDVSKSKIY